MEDLKEELILNQITQNIYYREKVIGHIKSSYFENNDNKKLFKVIHELIEKKVTILDRNTLLLNFPHQDKVDDILALSYPNENIPYLISTTESWCQLQSLKLAVMKSADIVVEKKDPFQIKSLIEDALSVSFDTDLGLDYINDIDSRFTKYGEEEKKISTGYTMLDHYTNGGLPTKKLVLFTGQPNLGKTMMLCNLACNMSASGANGVYLTLELDKETIGRRCDSINTQIPYFNLFKNKNKAINFFKSYKGGNIFIKEYPASKANSVNIRTYLKELEIHKKYKPDYLIVDYLNLMKPNNLNKMDNMYLVNFYISLELRELAIELDIPVITANQLTTSSIGATNVGLGDLRGGAGPAENADLIISLTQSEEQEPENLISWKIIKNRIGRKNGKLETQFHIETLKVNEILTSEDRAILDSKNDHNFIVEENKKYNDELSGLLGDEKNSNFSDFT